MKKTISLLKIIGSFLCLFYLQSSLGQNNSNTEEDNALPSEELNITTQSSTDNRPKIRLQFTSVAIINRQILLTVDDNCTDGYDWGYDGYLNDVQVDDMSWLIEDELFVIQGIGEINTEQTTLPLNIQKSNVGDVVISIHSLENIPDDLDIILYDTELGTHYDLRSTNYNATLEAGNYEGRFVIEFQNPSALSIDNNNEAQLDFYYEMNNKNLIVRNPTNLDVKHIEIYNISGQNVYNIGDILKGTYSEYNIGNLTSGIYVVKLSTDDNIVVTKKVIIK